MNLPKSFPRVDSSLASPPTANEQRRGRAEHHSANLAFTSLLSGLTETREEIDASPG